MKITPKLEIVRQWFYNSRVDGKEVFYGYISSCRGRRVWQL